MGHVRIQIWCIAIVTAIGAGPALVKAQMAPSFTYQGQLKDAGGAADGDYDFLFRLYDDPNSGMQIGGDVSADNLTVSNGLFTTQLDFGAGAFTGDARWLEVAVRPGASVDPHTALSPRQPLTPAPYALYALDSAGGGGSLWTADPNDPNNGISYTAGYVGVGEQYPWAPLTVVSPGGGEAIAVENWADGTSARLGGSSYGVSATTYSPGSAGVYGSNLSSGPGLCIGVWGRATNPDGYAGYFDGRGYFTDDVGIGRIPTAKLDVAGTLKADGFQLTDTPVAGYVLTSDASGVGTWQAAGGGSSLWTADPNNGISYQSGNVGIGASSWPSTRLLVDNAEAYTIRAHNGSTSGTTIAVYAEGDSTQARAVFADATATSGEAVGVFGRSHSPYGYGVWGANNSTATSPRPVGVYGTTSSSHGVSVEGLADGANAIGVRGRAAATSGNCTGVWGESSSTTGRGMYGYATSSSGQAVGILGETASPDGFGVYGYNDDDGVTGDAIGVLGSTNSSRGTGVKGHAYAPDGYGVYGMNEGGSGNAIGGYFKTNSTDGYGVYGEAAGALSGYAGYFVGRGYFSNNVGIGTASPGSPLTVAGLVESTTGGFKFPDGTVQATAGGGGGGYWLPNGSEIYYDAGNVGVGVSDPQSTLHVAGGNWDVATTEGDFKIGNSTYRLKMGVATDGGGAGTCRIFAGGPSSQLILGASGQDRLTVTSTEVDVTGTLETDGFQLTDSPTTGYVLTCDASGNGTWQAASGGGSFSLPYDGSISSTGPAFKITNTGADPNTCAAHFETTGLQSAAVHVKANGTYAAGLKAFSDEGAAVFAVSSDGWGLQAEGGHGAALFKGNVKIEGNVEICEYGTGDTVIELGKGLDYAEGFDVTDSDKVEPGAVLVLDSRNAGQLVMSAQAYDRKVAGIVAGAKGLGSGVRLGGEFDHDVALAGRVYCNVVAADEPIEIGDLLTTSDVPGCAMKVRDHQRAQGAILGKAMESLAAGEQGQILVLVTLQ